jgi:hypothetical protein
MITQEQYNSLKEYYDWQRVLEYNKEQAFHRAERIAEGMKEQEGIEFDVERVFEELWNATEQDEYEYPPPANWIPKNKDLQIEGIDDLKL